MERTNSPKGSGQVSTKQQQKERLMTSEPQHPANDYWKIRESYLEQLKTDFKLKRENRKRILVYLFRKLLWSFGFFPVFLAVWIPLLLSHFNLVVFFQQLETLITSFLSQTPNLQAATTESIIIGWASIGCMFMVFDLVLTPYRSPYEEQADAYMKARYMMFGISRKTKRPSQLHSADIEAHDHDLRPVYECEDNVDEEMMTNTAQHLITEAERKNKKNITSISQGDIAIAKSSNEQA
jgi:hypothetical protein